MRPHQPQTGNALGQAISKSSRNHVPKAIWLGVFIVLAVLGAVPMASHELLQGPAGPSTAVAPAAGVAQATAQPAALSPDPADIERKRQIADDSAALLKLATQLKAEVDKTDKDTLSIGVIRKADEVEKMAHNVREKLKTTLAAK